MAIEARTLKRRRVVTNRAEVQGIPKMELIGSKGPNNPASPLRKYDSLAFLIKAFGEFNLIADPNDIVVGFWGSRHSSSRRSAKAILGRPLNSLVQPALAAEIRTLAERTGSRHARQELECPLTIDGVRRWFSVSFIPLGTAGSDSSALCVAARDVTHRVEAMHSLAEREALLAKAEDVANFGSWETHLSTGEVKLSAQLAKIYDLAPGQKWSRRMYWERIHPNDAMRVHSLVDKSYADGQPVQYVARYCAPGGDIRVHITYLLPLIDETGKVVRAMGVIHDVTEHAKSHQELRRLSQQLMNEQDTQRRHLARELHESAGQSLASLKMTLGRLREAVAENPELVSDLLDSAIQLADGAIREVRTVTYVLHPPMLDDAGLRPALRWYTKGFAERSGISATLESAEPFPRFSQDIETTVFRVVQEALTNVHRYSGSSTAEIKLWHEDSKLQVEIRDRGCGFPPIEDPSQQRSKLGVGISGMRERVKQLNGDFEVRSVPGQGTTVRAVLPAVPVKSGLRLSQVSPRTRG
jgi:signal transduction histidine kinase